jgi:hypothetical protein
MPFTDDQMKAYSEFFTILGNVRRRQLMQEQAKKKKREEPKSPPVQVPP